MAMRGVFMTKKEIDLIPNHPTLLHVGAPINLGKDFMDGDRKYSRVVINSMMAAARTLLNWSNFLPHNYIIIWIIFVIIDSRLFTS